MAYPHPPLSQDLAQALRTLELFEPFRESVAAPAWKEAIGSVEGVCAALELIEAYRPGILTALAQEALAEDELRRRPSAEVTALVKRYASRLERR